MAPVIGAEEEFGYAIKEGWATVADSPLITKWRETGLKHSATIERELMSVFIEEYYHLMRKVKLVCFIHATEPGCADDAAAPRTSES